MKQRYVRLPLFTSILCTACSQVAPEAYTSAAGSVDHVDTFTFDPNQLRPPIHGGNPFSQGRLQEDADHLIGQRVANFVAHRDIWSLLSSQRWHYFFPSATAANYPGMCQARVFQMTERRSGKSESVTQDGWKSPVFGIVGSVAPMPKP